MDFIERCIEGRCEATEVSGIQLVAKFLCLSYFLYMVNVIKYK